MAAGEAQQSSRSTTPSSEATDLRVRKGLLRSPLRDITDMLFGKDGKLKPKDIQPEMQPTTAQAIAREIQVDSVVQPTTPVAEEPISTEIAEESEALPTSETPQMGLSRSVVVDLLALLSLDDRMEVYGSNGTLTAEEAYCRSQLHKQDVETCGLNVVIGFQIGTDVWYEPLTYKRMWEQREPLRYHQFFGDGETPPPRGLSASAAAGFRDEDIEYCKQVAREQEQGKIPAFVKFLI
ncbi:MAG: hypothetical protein Q9168_006877 [Polycauliona sp. 1 TL-2023]